MPWKQRRQTRVPRENAPACPVCGYVVNQYAMKLLLISDYWICNCGAGLFNEGGRFTCLSDEEKLELVVRYPQISSFLRAAMKC